jgi:small subunit ribosomal protein S8
MSLSDPIADMLTRVRNALGAGLETVEMPHSRLKTEVARILKREGFVTDYVVEGDAKKTMRVYLKYTADQKPVMRGLRRESKPGLRRYVTAADIPRVLGGMGICVLSTSSGVMTGKDAYKQKIGGELLCSIW